MPVVSVSVPHEFSRDDVKQRAEPYIEKIIDDFEGHDLDLEWEGHKAVFHFKSLAFTITGHVDITDDQITVDVDLPLMAMLFKDKVEKSINKNLHRALVDGEAEAQADAGAEGNSEAE